MNYDLCDLLNRKLEHANGYLQDFPNRSSLKNQNVLDETLESIAPDLYVSLLDSEFYNHECFGFWVWRYGISHFVVLPPLMGMMRDRV